MLLVLAFLNNAENAAVPLCHRTHYMGCIRSTRSILFMTGNKERKMTRDVIILSGRGKFYLMMMRDRYYHNNTSDEIGLKDGN